MKQNQDNKENETSEREMNKNKPRKDELKASKKRENELKEDERREMREESEDKRQKSLFMMALYGEKQELMRLQLENIEQEIEKREAIDKESLEMIDKEILEVENVILTFNPQDGPPASEDPETLKERLGLEKEKRDLTQEIRDEKRDCWRDIQHLRREEREKQNEHNQVTRRKRKFDEAL